MMADRGRKVSSSRAVSVSNPLLQAAQFPGTSLPLPVPLETCSAQSADVGEPDNFIGQESSAPVTTLSSTTPLDLQQRLRTALSTVSLDQKTTLAAAPVPAPGALPTFTYFSSLSPTEGLFGQPPSASATVDKPPPPPPVAGPALPFYAPEHSAVPVVQPAISTDTRAPSLIPSKPPTAFVSPNHPSPTPSPPSFLFQQGKVEPPPPVTNPPSSPYGQLPQATLRPSLVSVATPPTGAPNTYRLSGQKKLQYVQPPGLRVASPIVPSLSAAAGHVSPPSRSSTPLMPATMPPTPAINSSASLPYQATLETTADPSLIPPSFSNLSQGQPVYRPVYHHWFHKKEVETKVLWQPFSMVDSLALEEGFTSTDISPETTVPTDGGRYDVNILLRQRSAVYWEEAPTEVRRCSWFYKGAIDSRYVPYDESLATKLEEEFKVASTSNEWHRSVEFPNGETVVFHGPSVMVHFPQAPSPDAWGNTPQVPTRPRVVKRGVDEFDIDEGEPSKVDHLLFLVHGVGSACDLRFRSVVEVVDDFRNLSLQLVQSHFRSAVDHGQVNRIEVLPISWHSTLHGEDTGIDRKLKSITLQSIPKLRHFTNDTLLDILFYTSPVFCQTIMHTVGKEINRLFDLFRSRHPSFDGGVSLGGHSLGSLILFDLLCHQKPPPGASPAPPSREGSVEPITVEEDTLGPMTIKVPPHKRKLSHRVSYVMGNAGTGQPYITYPQLNFHPKAFFAMGSPIGMFVTVRGIDTLGEDFRLPTCPSFYNIFHPFDPVAYRIETLINPDFTSLKPVMIPHHKGRKRMHLELKETMARVGADLKQKLLDSVRSTWNTVYQLAMFHRSDSQTLEQEVDKVLEEQMKQEETESTNSTEDGDQDVCVGQLNGGQRVDYVLQEAPLESFNEYLFALGSHVCYWESEDTMLMILKEVYASMGISSDSNVARPNLPLEGSSDERSPARPYTEALLFNTPSSSTTATTMSRFVGDDSGQDALAAPDFHSDSLLPSPSQPQMGMDPTAPLSENKNLGPPPMSGFVRKQ